MNNDEKLVDVLILLNKIAGSHLIDHESTPEDIFISTSKISQLFDFDHDVLLNHCNVHNTVVQSQYYN